jgi:hypothetical protein
VAHLRHGRERLPFLGGAGIHRPACVTGFKAPAKIKDLIREVEAETRAALVGVMGQVISAGFPWQ